MAGNVRTNSAKEKIAENDPWYVSDQFEEQCQNLAANWVIAHRWQVWKKFLKSWKQQNGSSIGPAIQALDAGCGDGINLLGLQKILRETGLGFSLYGLDYNELRLQRVANRFNQVKIVSGSLLNLPFADGNFDIILCNHVLEHVPDDRTAMKELRRILRPGGLLIVGTPNEGCAIAQFRNHVVQPAIAKTTDHVQFYTWPVLKKRLNEANLNIIDIKRESFFLPHLFLNYFFGRYRAGQLMLRILQYLFPSQSAGLIAYCQK